MSNGGGMETTSERSGDGGRGSEDTSIRSERQDTILNDTKQSSTEQSTTEHHGTGISSGIRELPESGGGRVTSRDRELPSIFTKSREDLELQYFKGFKERCTRVLGELQRSDGYIVRDVFRFESDAEYKNLLAIIQGDRHYSRGLLQISREPTHVHIAHDCAWSNGTCRCNWYQKAKTYGLHQRRDRRGHRRDYCRSRTMSDVEKLLLYYCTKGRKLCYQKIGSTVERIPSSGYNLQEAGFTELPESLREMEVQIPGDGDEFRQWEPVLEDDEPAERVSYAEPGRKKRKMGAQERIQLKIVKMMEDNPICPPQAIIKHKVWRTDEDLRFKDFTCKEVKSAVQCYTDNLTTWSMEEYQKMYNNERCQPIFSAGYGSFSDYYYNVENSIEVMERLIQFQCGGEEDAVLDFVTTLYNVIERKVPKLNTIVILSPSSAGKNFFFDAVKDYYINCGHLSNANKYNNFPFQDAEGRRIVLWNEPNYSPEYLDQIKEILGGDSTCVNVKYQHDTPVYRTPVIVLTNNVVTFMTNQAFTDRVKVYNWQAAPFLKHYDKKPNPLAVYHFFKKYNLVK